MAQTPQDPNAPLDWLARLGWNALEAARRAPRLDEVARQGREALASAQRAFSDSPALRTTTVHLPLDGAERASVTVGYSVGDATLRALPLDQADALLSAELAYLGAIAFGVTGEAAREAFLRQAAPVTVGWANPATWANRPRWDVALARGVPLALHVLGGVGALDANLGGLRLTSLRVEANVGPLNLTLPSGGAGFSGTVRGGANLLALNIPPEAHATLTVSGGLALRVHLARGAALRVSGPATLDVPPDFVADASTPGAWHTPDYALARYRVALAADGLVGGVSVAWVGGVSVAGAG